MRLRSTVKINKLKSRKMNQCNNGSIILVPSRPSLQGALGAALGAVVAGLVLTGGQAKALTVVNVKNVNVGGQNYDVTTFTGSYNENASKFTTTDMPWWGNSTLADQFAAAVGDRGGLPNSDDYAGQGPAFAYRAGALSPYKTDVVETYSYFSATPYHVALTDTIVYRLYGNSTYATASYSASSSTASVPGPLPIFGLAAAFGFSRKLRKRIKLHKGTSAVSTSPGA